MNKSKTHRLILVCLIMQTIKSQVERCGDIQSFSENQNYKISGPHHWNYLMQGYVQNFFQSMHKLGKGAFGQVYRCTVNENPNKVQGRIPKQFQSAFKFQRFNPQKMNIVQNELKFLQYVAKIHPLYLLHFYNCAVDLQRNNLFVLTEMLDSDLKDGLAQMKFTRYGKQKALELLLMMAIGVKNLHMTGYGHFDIKLDNFMLKRGNYNIIKIIDYGMVSLPGITKKAFGTPSYWGPEMILSQPYITTRKSDLYSLGITFFALFYGIESIKMTKKEEITDINAATEYYNYVKGQIEGKVDLENEKEIQGEDERDKETRIKLAELIVKLTKINPNERINIVDTVQELERLLKQYDQDSIYLEKNVTELFNEVYPNYGLTKNFNKGMLNVLEPVKPKKKGYSLGINLFASKPEKTQTEYNITEILAGNTFVQHQEDVADRYVSVPKNRFTRPRPTPIEDDTNESQNIVQNTDDMILI